MWKEIAAACLVLCCTTAAFAELLGPSDPDSLDSSLSIAADPYIGPVPGMREDAEVRAMPRLPGMGEESDDEMRAMPRLGPSEPDSLESSLENTGEQRVPASRRPYQPNRASTDLVDPDSWDSTLAN